MKSPVSKQIVFLGLIASASVCAHAMTINCNFTTGDTTDFPGSFPISQAPNAALIETTIKAATAQVTGLIANTGTYTINFVDDPTTGLGESVNTGTMDLSYSSFLSYLKANPIKSVAGLTALASLPSGSSIGINGNATQVSLGGVNLNILGDSKDGNALISANNGFIGTIGLNFDGVNLSRTNINPNNYDLFSTAAHEVGEVLGIGGQGSTLGQGTSDVGVLDLYRYSASGVRSYTASSNAVSYFSINGGKTSLVHFNQSPDGDYSDWGDGVKPGDDQGNTPSQVQDAFASPGVTPNMGRNEAIALDVNGWNLSAAGLAMEGTNQITGTLNVPTNTQLSGALSVVTNSTLLLGKGASLISTNVVSVAGTLTDNSALAFTNTFKGKVSLVGSGTLQKSYPASNSVAGFGATLGNGISFYLLAGFVTNSSILNAQLVNGALNFKGTYGNAVVLSFSGTTNSTIQWWDTNVATPFWTNTVAGDTNIATKYFNYKGFSGSFSNFLLTNAVNTTNSRTWLTTIMGAYGYDTTTKTSWAVIDHNSLFDSGDGGLPDLTNLSALSNSDIPNLSTSGITFQAVPEPSSFVLLGIGVLALMAFSRRLTFTQRPVPVRSDKVKLQKG